MITCARGVPPPVLHPHLRRAGTAPSRCGMSGVTGMPCACFLCKQPLQQAAQVGPLRVFLPTLCSLLLLLGADSRHWKFIKNAVSPY